MHCLRDYCTGLVRLWFNSSAVNRPQFDHPALNVQRVPGMYLINLVLLQEGTRQVNWHTQVF